MEGCYGLLPMAALHYIMKKTQIRKIHRASRHDNDVMPYRAHRCHTYQTCLENAARFDLVLDCSDCKNIRLPEPQHNDGFAEMVIEDTCCCLHLLRAIFHPERHRYEHPLVKTIEPDAPLAEVEW